jgi:orotate phosphoribosyltransferase
MYSNKPCVFIRNQKKDYGTAKQVEGILNSGERVVIVEDVLTTGGQVIEAAGSLKSMGATIDRIIAVIDREEGARQNIENAGYTFEALFTTTDLGVLK